MLNSLKVINKYDLEDVSLTLGKQVGEQGRVIIFPVEQIVIFIYLRSCRKYVTESMAELVDTILVSSKLIKVQFI